MLSELEQQELRKIVRDTLEAYVRRREVPDFTVSSETLKNPRGAFVTLEKKGELRGCIGYINAVKPLWLTVRDMTVAACSHDYRFEPVRPDELLDITFEISVLSPLEKITSFGSIVVGKHGLYLHKGSNSGLLLPQVATEYGWDREEFLQQTCRKAGLSHRDLPQCEVFIFTADIF